MARVSLQKLALATAGAALYLTAIEANQAFAATFTVTNTNESGAGSLRQAITEANTTPEPNSIDFVLDAGPQTIFVTSGELLINGNLTINGLGPDLLTLSGSETGPPYDITKKGNRIFEIGSDSTVNISGLTITKGNLNPFLGGGYGAGILNSGNLRVTNSTISNNIGSSSSGIANSGTLTLVNSTVSGNLAGAGGPGTAGIGNGGTLTVINSTISNNTGGTTGGISNGGTLTVIDSTFRENFTTAFGASISNSGTATVTNSTFSNNRISGGRPSAGGIYNTGTATVTNSTFKNNGLGIFNTGDFNGKTYISGYLELTNSTFIDAIENSSVFLNNPTAKIGNTIIVNGTAINSPSVIGNFISLGYNLIGNAGSSTGFGAIGDIVGTSAAPIDPKLSPLQNNGGPTQTIALLPGSPAIDAANPNSFPPTDQRGVPRPQGPRADIGAYELQQKVQPVPEPEEETVAFFTVMSLGFLLKKKKAASLSAQI